jgi:hypothetical protein
VSFGEDWNWVQIRLGLNNHRIEFSSKKRDIEMTQKKQFTKTLIAKAIIVLMTSSSSTGFAQSTATNLYTAALTQMQTENYQSLDMPQATLANTTMAVTAFAGGALQGGVMTFGGSSGTPASATVFSLWVSNCNPTSNPGSYTYTNSFTDSSTISSSSSVTNTSTSFNSGSATVTLGYTPPGETGGVSASASATYNWGSSYSTASTSSNSSTNGTSDTQSVSVSATWTASPWTQTLVQVNVSTTTSNSIPWTAPVSLTSPSNSPLTNITYSQMFKNSTPPNQPNTMIGNVPVNLWSGNTTWEIPFVLTSPNGLYSVQTFDTINYLGTFMFNGLNSMYYYWNNEAPLQTSGGSLVFTPYLTNNSLTMNNSSGQIIWSSIPGQDEASEPAYFLGLGNDGHFETFGSNPVSDDAIWGNDYTSGGSTPYTIPLAQPYIPTPTQLMGTSPIIASGTYSGTSYSSTGTMTATSYPAGTNGSPACANAPSSSASTSKDHQKVAYKEEPSSTKNSSVRDFASTLLEKTGLIKTAHAAENDDRNIIRKNIDRSSPNTDRRIIPDASRKDNSLAPDNRDGQGSARKKIEAQKITKPFYLKPGQYASATIPGLGVPKIEIIPLPGSNFTTETKFIPAELKEMKSANTRTKEFKIIKNKKITHNVKKG